MQDLIGSLALNDGRWRIGGAIASVTQHVAPIGATQGGDRADVFMCPDGSLHVCVLDACGHGEIAERVATFAQNALRVLICGGESPASALTLLDRLLVHLENGDRRFVTAFVASFDRSLPLIRYASAGHVEALLLAGDRHEHLPATGPMLGLSSEAQYQERYIERSTSAALIVATDGVLDSRPMYDPDAFLGTYGLLTLARRLAKRPSELTATRLLVDARRRAGGAFRDDAAVLVARFGTVR